MLVPAAYTDSIACNSASRTAHGPRSLRVCGVCTEGPTVFDVHTVGRVRDYSAFQVHTLPRAPWAASALYRVGGAFAAVGAFAAAGRAALVLEPGRSQREPLARRRVQAQVAAQRSRCGIVRSFADHFVESCLLIVRA